MVKFELSEQEMNNLKVFLGRVQLTGVEVPEYINLLNKINSPIKEDKNENFSS